nr:immunoglobulin heavy chain junction region [Macaca mulatta]MOV49147.1 immunoglobulin heavy chain junction region [Macaca mulatta]MOV49620.1 immunoglobulin heavy chain junction region [Macaca mulatta]MOV49908.1 immunoglobulin heavy chain junction region [Macaca mulatta]MOV49910.1 immunoglobulin heavy chain junction region [Macaca mulatta]
CAKPDWGDYYDNSLDVW